MPHRVDGGMGEVVWGKPMLPEITNIEILFSGQAQGPVPTKYEIINIYPINKIDNLKK